MKILKITKLIAGALMIGSILALSPLGLSEEWKKDNIGWLYSEGNFLDNGWKKISNLWDYFKSDSDIVKVMQNDGDYLDSNGAGTNDVKMNNGESGLNSLGQEILNNISTQNPTFSLKYDGDAESAGKAVQAEIDNLKYTHPYETYNITQYTLSLSWSGRSNIVDIKVSCTYKMTAEMEASLDSKAREIVASITSPNMDQFKKERAIHDWIINNTKYDQSYSIYDPYNTLMKHTGVCEGYTLLAQKMFTIAGIKSIIVSGHGNGEAHAWNMVNINEKWYHVDLTWDDPVSTRNILRYDYYNLTDSKMKTDHTWEASKYPSAK